MTVYTPWLTNIDGFQNLEEVGNNCHLRLDAFETLDIPNLRQVGGGISISGPANISGFSNLKKIGNYLGVHSDRTTHISGFDMLEEVRDITFSENKELLSVEGFEKVKKIGRVRLLDCPKLSQLTAFANVETLDQDWNFICLGLPRSLPFLSLDRLRGFTFLRIKISQPYMNSQLLNMQEDSESIQTTICMLYNLTNLTR